MWAISHGSPDYEETLREQGQGQTKRGWMLAHAQNEHENACFLNPCTEVRGE